MVPSTLGIPRHVAIIMDGNGRWGTERGLERAAGHAAGAENVRRIVQASVEAGIGVLSLYAFSADNWKRPPAEVTGLMELFQMYLVDELVALREQGIRLSIIGRRDRLPFALQAAIRFAEKGTAAGRRLHLRIAIDYSSRAAIVAAASRWGNRPLDADRFSRLIGLADRGGAVPPVDLLIRTGGERRLSDFLLWESAYAELWFTDKQWPAFEAADLAEALSDFWRRERRFGALPEQPETRRVAGAR